MKALPAAIGFLCAIVFKVLSNAKHEAAPPCVHSKEGEAADAILEERDGAEGWEVDEG